MGIKSGHLRWFDASRGIAAIVVLIAHSFQVFRSSSFGADALSIGSGIAAEYAVYAFFFMSGYLITLSIRNNVRRDGRFDGLEYASSRIARIYPPLIGAIIIVVGVGFIIKTLDLAPIDLPGRPAYAFDIAEIWTCLSLRSGLGVTDGPLWSLYIEGQIYIIAGGVAMIGWSRKLLPVLIGAAAVLIGLKLHKNEWFLFYGALWLAGAVASFIQIPSVTRAPPRWMTAAGGFSYSLYVIHFPLLLLAWSIVQTTGMAVTNIISMLVSAAAILPISYAFSLALERPAYFKNAFRRYSAAVASL